MAHINLLPWRDEVRAQKQKEFGVVTVMAVIATALIIFLVHMQIDGAISHQQSRNDYITQETKALDKKIAEIKELKATRERLLARMNVIQNLQLERPNIVHVFDEIATLTPSGIRYDIIKQTANILEFKGTGESAARVADLMRNLEKSEWFDKQALIGQGIKAETKNEAGYSFTITATITPPKAEEEDK